MTEPHTTLPNLLKAFAHYGFVSNLKINLTKSESMNINLSPTNLARTRENCPFKWEKIPLKYLGIWLTPKLSLTYDSNYPPLLQVIEKDLKIRNAGYFSWFGRATILKMVILPRLLYALYALPTPIPHKLFFKSCTRSSYNSCGHTKDPGLCLLY